MHWASHCMLGTPTSCQQSVPNSPPTVEAGALSDVAWLLAGAGSDVARLLTGALSDVAWLLAGAGSDVAWLLAGALSDLAADQYNETNLARFCCKKLANLLHVAKET